MTKGDLEKGQTTLKFRPIQTQPRPPSSSSVTTPYQRPTPTDDSRSDASTSRASTSGTRESSTSRDDEQDSHSRSSRGSGRGRSRGRGRGSRRGRWGGGGDWEARREANRLIASENESLHIPMLMSASPALRTAILSTVVYPCLPPTTNPPSQKKRTKFRFWNCDSFEAAERLVSDFGADSSAVLNMANAFTPGGGYINGATAQEEALCRRSTLYAHIAQPQYYPIHEEGGLWSPSVRVFRHVDGEVMNSDESFSCGVISVAAINRPLLTPSKDNYASPQELQTTIHKIMSMLRIAKLQDQKAVVLGAFGCGAFQNPPEAMASLFKRALTVDAEFEGAFDEVVFAILEVSGSDNMRPWKKVWEGVAEEDEFVRISSGGSDESQQQDESQSPVIAD
ncbi:hypothetical protein T439DRAFT_326546 [Meredithblackwellia eburnea MCA 4105]